VSEIVMPPHPLLDYRTSDNASLLASALGLAPPS
jgi:hypothetical protein